MEIQNCEKHFVTISRMAATAAILKISVLLAHLELMPWSVGHGPSLIRMSVSNFSFHILDISIRIISMMAAMAAILKVFNRYLLPNSKSDGA